MATSMRLSQNGVAEHGFELVNHHCGTCSRLGGEAGLPPPDSKPASALAAALARELCVQLARWDAWSDQQSRHENTHHDEPQHHLRDQAHHDPHPSGDPDFDGKVLVFPS